MADKSSLIISDTRAKTLFLGQNQGINVIVHRLIEVVMRAWRRTAGGVHK